MFEQPTLTNELEREQRAQQSGLAGQAYEEEAAKKQQLKAVVELLMQNTPPEDIIKAGYSIDIVKLAIQMLSRQEAAARQAQEGQQQDVGVLSPPGVPLNESLAGGNVMM